MQTFRTTTRRALVVAVLALGGLLMLGGGSAAGDGLLKPPQPCGGTRRGDIGEMQMERLPWNVHVLRADLSRDRPVAIAGFYVFDRHLIVVAQSGMVWCLDRFNLEPRWANMLSAPLFQPPAEGATHFTFLCKDYRGQYWLHAISKRSGEEGPDFPRRLGFAASSGVAANASMAFMGSLGAAHHNKTFESVNLVDGRGGWGYLAPGMVFAAPQMDAAGKNVVFTTDNGHVISLPAGALPPRGPNWDKTTGNNMKYGPGLSPEQVVVASRDGVVTCLDLDNGDMQWIGSVGDEPTAAPWIMGGVTTVETDTGIEGADPIRTTKYVGMAIVRNVRGLHAFDLASGEGIFKDLNAVRPLARAGDWLLTLDAQNNVTFRNAKKGYAAAEERLELGMFDLIPTNRVDGALYAATSDGSIVAAIPK
ncbi:MAG: hypothetical protein H6806_07420 [Planctomycetes bacterium]|nr:hypothetical protein [Planctomycetota bacterium]MCB9826222.1 hypothetical protein [Planctomycetota bacterium]MCB9829573.1 hypothetical protein [Planctomycetota bacterium]MCB9902224.1 hypothetical protein [Planctomycetota bacterium]